MMEFYAITPPAEQFMQLFWFFLYGALVGVWAGFWKGLSSPAHPILRAGGDFLLLFVPSVGFFLLSLALCGGRLRLLLAGCTLAGAVLWRLSAGRLLQKIWRPFCQALGGGVKKLGHFTDKAFLSRLKSTKNRKIFRKNEKSP